MNRICVVFDLDDTLYKEIEFLRSGYSAVIEYLKTHHNFRPNLEKLMSLYLENKNPFEFVLEKVSDCSMEKLLEIYRFHKPQLQISKENIQLFNEFREQGIVLGVITDGRSVTQRNKIESLGLFSFFKDNIIISEECGFEKPNHINYSFFENKYPGYKYFYIGDNIRKDFVYPNSSSFWTSVGIIDSEGLNIHSQGVKVEKGFLPDFWISELSEIKGIIP